MYSSLRLPPASAFSRALLQCQLLQFAHFFRFRVGLQTCYVFLRYSARTFYLIAERTVLLNLQFRFGPSCDLESFFATASLSDPLSRSAVSPWTTDVPAMTLCNWPPLLSLVIARVFAIFTIAQLAGVCPKKDLLRRPPSSREYCHSPPLVAVSLSLAVVLD